MNNKGDRGFALLGILIAVTIIALLSIAFLQGGDIFSPKGDKTPQAIIDEAERAQEQLDERTEMFGEQLQESQTQYTAPAFLLLLEDNGEHGKQIGCNDSVVAVPLPAKEIGSDMQQSVEALLALKETEITVGGTTYYNALVQSDLTFAGLWVRQGKATLALEGTIRSGGVCDDPRIDAQLFQTLLQFPNVQKVEIQLNGSQEEYVRQFQLR